MSSTFDLNLNVILFVGRPADSNKGLVVLLDAAEILTTFKDLPLFCVWIVGGSPREVGVVTELINAKPALRLLAEGGRISLWGRVENPALSEIYSRSVVTVVPSFFEEFGIVAVEAMMSGCPVVASRVGGLENIVESGRTGELFEAGNTGELAKIIAVYLADSERRTIHGNAARERAVELFSTDKAYASIARIYLQDQSGQDKD